MVYPGFSNFYNCRIRLNGFVYSNTEAIFQVQKTLNEEEQLKFTSLTDGQKEKLKEIRRKKREKAEYEFNTVMMQ